MAVTIQLGLPTVDRYSRWAQRHFHGPGRLHLAPEQRQSLWAAAPERFRIFEVVESKLND